MGDSVNSVSVQERIASFPRRVVVDLKGLACATRYGIVDPGEPGYQPFYGVDDRSLAELDEMLARALNTRAPTEAEREAAKVGSMFGWHVPGADPATWEARKAAQNAD